MCNGMSKGITNQLRIFFYCGNRDNLTLIDKIIQTKSFMSFTLIL